MDVCHTVETAELTYALKIFSCRLIVMILFVIT